MNTPRKAYPSDLRDAEWDFLLSYISYISDDASQRL